jgi:hypothetical protein
LKLKTIKPLETRKDTVSVVIEFEPRRKRNVGIGYVDEGEATLDDFKKYPVVERPWLDLDIFSK